MASARPADGTLLDCPPEQAPRSLRTVNRVLQVTPRRVCKTVGRYTTWGLNTPTFMDYHDHLHLPAEAISQITEDKKNAKTDEFGVRQVELFHNPDGQVYCLLEAPDADAVRTHHEAIGVPCGDVHEVQSLLKLRSRRTGARRSETCSLLQGSC